MGDAQSCYQSQNYKIWKQFTTDTFSQYCKLMLLSITKLQNLKAIHNAVWGLRIAVVVVINHKTTKFESNSQRYFPTALIPKSCYQSQNYKIWKQFTTQPFWHCKSTKLLSITWKQFTTIDAGKMQEGGLLSITKLQNLKAIHNYWLSQNRIYVVVINHKTTKFESNSQLSNGKGSGSLGCYQS